MSNFSFLSNLNSNNQNSNNANNGDFSSDNLQPNANQQTIEFFDRDKKFFEFTTFYEAYIVIDGIDYRTVEHYFRAMEFTNPETQQYIRSLKTAREAMDVARKLELEGKARPDWNEVKTNIMYQANKAKFEQGVKLNNMLLDTNGYQLVFASPFDDYFGIGQNKQGQNILGGILMQLRGELPRMTKNVGFPISNPNANVNYSQDRIYFNSEDLGNPFRIFSPMTEASFQAEGYTWPTLMHYYQAQKFPVEEWTKISQIPSAIEAIKYASSISNKIRQDWSQIQDQAMEKAIRAMLDQNLEAKKLLMDSGSRQLFYKSNADRFYGTGADDTGENRLGRILGKIRNELQGNSGDGGGFLGGFYQPSQKSIDQALVNNLGNGFSHGISNGMGNGLNKKKSYSIPNGKIGLGLEEPIQTISNWQNNQANKSSLYNFDTRSTMFGVPQTNIGSMLLGKPSPEQLKSSYNKGGGFNNFGVNNNNNKGGFNIDNFNGNNGSSNSYFMNSYRNPYAAQADYNRYTSSFNQAFGQMANQPQSICFGTTPLPPLFVTWNGMVKQDRRPTKEKNPFILTILLPDGKLQIVEGQQADLVFHFHLESQAITVSTCILNPAKTKQFDLAFTVLWMMTTKDHVPVTIEQFFEVYETVRYRLVDQMRRM